MGNFMKTLIKISLVALLLAAQTQAMNNGQDEEQALAQALEESKQQAELEKVLALSRQTHAQEQDQKALAQALAASASTQAPAKKPAAPSAKPISDAQLAQQLQSEHDAKVAQELARNEERARKEQQAREAKLARELAERERKQQESKKIYPIKEISIEQLKVIPQKNAECGFHAIHNCALLLQSNGMPKADIEAELNNATNFNIEGMKKKAGECGMIDGASIMDLAKQFYGLDKNSYTVLPNLKQALSNLTSKKPKQTTIQYIPSTLVKALRTLRTAEKATHGFIVGNMSITRINGKLQINHGHWITVVAHKNNNKITLYCADSLIDSHCIEYAQDIQKLIETACCAELEKVTK